MRSLAASLLLMAACAHAQRSRDPRAWVELESEHFLLHTDLPPDEARRSMADLEQVRAALFAAGWHSSRPSHRRTHVVELESVQELEEFAVKRLDGFVATDAFGEPIMVVSAGDAAGQPVLKHELAHVITDEFLVSKPRWVAEGIACYLETLRLDRGRGRIVMGDSSPARRAWLKEHPVLDYTWMMQSGAAAELMDADAQYAFETGSWLLVYWLVNTRTAAFDDFLQRLARGEEWQRAFHAVFPDLGETAIRAGMKAYFKSATIRLDEGPAPSWSGAIALRSIDAGEVHALRADLIRLSPGYPRSSERAALVQAEVALALQADPGNPLALRLSPDADPRPALAAHPGDWRAWVLAADRNKADPSAIETAARLAPGNAGVLERLAILALGRGEPDLAVQQAEAAVVAAPGRPDALDTLAQVYATLSRCEEAHAVEQRAIDAWADAASGTKLEKRLEQIDRHCGEQGIERHLLVQPVQKGCRLRQPMPRPRDSVSGTITGEFTIREDGSVARVSVSGDATPRFLEAVKRYFESCSYEPVLDEGRPLVIQSTVQIRFAVRGK